MLCLSLPHFSTPCLCLTSPPSPYLDSPQLTLRCPPLLCSVLRCSAFLGLLLLLLRVCLGFPSQHQPITYIQSFPAPATRVPGYKRIPKYLLPCLTWHRRKAYLLTYLPTYLLAVRALSRISIALSRPLSPSVCPSLPLSINLRRLPELHLPTYLSTGEPHPQTRLYHTRSINQSLTHLLFPLFQLLLARLGGHWLLLLRIMGLDRTSCLSTQR